MRRAVLILCLLASPLLAQPSPVTVSITPNGPTVGDPVQATISLRVPAAELAGEPRFPVWGKTWGEAEIVKAEEPTEVSPGVWEQRLTVAAFKPGQVALTPVQISVPRRTGTVLVPTPAGLAIAVRSVIPPNEKDPKPKPAAALRPLPVGERFWWTAAVLSALCLLGAWLLYRQSRRRRATSEAARPALPPFEELAAELDRLRAEPSTLAHTRLSFALRRYLGRRLPFPAVESTTSEIQRQLLSRRMPGPLARQTVELLRACDLVKFARQEVGETLTRERAETARRLAAEFEARLAPHELERAAG
ncbi:MAG TPA: hypothetical protein VHC97_02845 [Thermoanaerobaculia bacterium]|nr:hypothetical protein [Thermoanaerobaculia bacterium]